MKIIGVEYENGNPFALDNGCVAIDVTTDGEDRVRFVPLIRAKWVQSKDSFQTICSNCHNAAGLDEYRMQLLTEWCPHCGAHMILVGGEEV